MITNGIIRFLKAVFGAVVKAAAWLLFAFGLWFPCVFVLAFLLICAFTATPLVSVLQTFIVGLVFSAVAGIVISFYIDKAKRKSRQVVRKTEREIRREERRARKKKEESLRDVAEDSADDASVNDENSNTESASEQSRNTYSGYEPKESFAVGSVPLPVSEVSAMASDIREDGNEHIKEETRPVFDDEYESEMRKKYFGESERESYNGYDYESAARRRLDKINEDESRPLVFRSRTDKDIYIYEFEDRLQIYRRTSYGMRLIDVRPKKTH